jgi:hypothetical protein
MSSQPGPEHDARHPRQVVAERAAVAPEYVDRLVQLGIVSPDENDGFSDGDVRRVGIVASVERSGLPLDGLAEALRVGRSRWPSSTSPYTNVSPRSAVRRSAR